MAVTVSSVANAAVPEVSCVPEALTPGRLILADPSKATPPIFTLEANFVAVAAFPEVSCVPEVLTPARSISAVPLKLTPPMFTLEAKAVAVAAFPVQEPEEPETFPVNAPIMLL